MIDGGRAESVTMLPAIDLRDSVRELN
jgi:hypothetical protein